MLIGTHSLLFRTKTHKTRGNLTGRVAQSLSFRGSNHVGEVGGKAMKSTAIIVLIAIVVSASPAQLASGRLTTSFYGWQGRSASLAKQDYLRAYENVQLDFSRQLFSVSTNFQLSKDFGKVISTDPELRLSSLVVRARNIADLVDVSLGRQFVFAGVGNGLIDGAAAKATLFQKKVGVTAYGGYNVIQSRTINLDRAFPENSLLGGQVTVEPVDNGTVGLSYMKRTRKPEPFTALRADSLFNPYAVIIAASPFEEEYASVDCRYEFLGRFDVYGRSDYDFNFERISRGQFYVRAGILQALNASVEYLFREPRIAYNSIFSVFTSNSTQEVELGVEYEVTPMVRTYGRFANVQYKDANSGRVTIGASADAVNVSYTHNLGYAGDLDGISVQAVCPMKERSFVPNLGFGLARYQLSDSDKKNTVLTTSVGTTYRPTPKLSADLQVQWMKNPLYANDLRLFAKVNYWFTERLGWF